MNVASRKSRLMTDAILYSQPIPLYCMFDDDDDDDDGIITNVSSHASKKFDNDDWIFFRIINTNRVLNIL